MYGIEGDFSGLGGNGVITSRSVWDTDNGLQLESTSGYQQFAVAPVSPSITPWWYLTGGVAYRRN